MTHFFLQERVAFEISAQRIQIPYVVGALFKCNGQNINVFYEELIYLEKHQNI